MQFALAIFPTERVQPPDELARMAEARGFEALLLLAARGRPGRGRGGMDEVAVAADAYRRGGA